MRRIGKAIALVILFGVTIMTAIARAESLPVENGGFEEANGSEPAYWANVNGKLNPVGTFERSAEKSCEGSYSLKISKPSSAGVMGVYSAGTVGIYEYRVYEAEAYVYTADATLTPELFLEFYDMTGVKISVGSFKTSGTAGKGAWEKLTVRAAAPRGAVMARVMPYIGAGSYGTMYADAVKLSAEPLLKNTAFDGNTDHWTAVSGTVNHENGKMKVAGGIAEAEPYYAASGVEYVFAGGVSGISGGGAYAALTFYADGTALKTVKKAIADGAFSVRGYAPADTTAVNVFVQAEGEAYFDDLLLTPAGKGTQAPDGGFESLGETGTSPWTIDTLTDTTELLPGGDFETNDWSISEDYCFGGVTTAEHATGSRAGFFMATYGGGMRSPLIPATPGVTYTAKTKYKSPACDMQFYIEFWSDWPADANATNRIGVTLSRPAATSVWTETSVSLTAPAGTKYLSVTPYFSAGTGGRARTAYFDDVIVTDQSGNTVFSYGFEDIPQTGRDWCISNPTRGAIVRDLHKKVSGNFGMTLSTNTTEYGGCGFRSPMVAGVPGSRYTVSMKYITLNSTLRLYLEFWPDDTFTARLGEDYVNLPASAGWSWTDASITRVAPEGTRYITASVYFLYTEGGALGYFDDITLRTEAAERVSPDETMLDGALSDGAYSLRLDGETASSPAVPVLSGKEYAAAADVQGDGTARMTLTFYNKEGEALKTETASAGGTARERLVIDTVAPFMSFSAGISLSTDGASRFDNVELYPVGDTLANPSFENTDMIIGGRHASQWQSVGDVAALTSGGEDNPDGVFALEIYGTGDGFVRSSMIRVAENTDYTARIYAKGNGGGMRIAFYDGDLAPVGTSTAIPFAGESFARYEISGTAPVGSVYAAIEIAAAQGEHFFVDHAAFSKRVTDVGSKTQLFIDDFLLDRTSNVTRTFHQGEKTAPILEKAPDRPHEENGVYIYGTVLYDEEEELFKMWYTSYANNTSGIGVTRACYATSTDGIHFEKPNLGLVEFNGSTANNITGVYEIQSVIKDRNETDPAKRYKMITYNTEGAYSSWYGPDGVHWTRSLYFLNGRDVITAAYDGTNDRIFAVAKVMLGKRDEWTMTAEDIDAWSIPVAANTLADLADTKLCYRADCYGMGLYEKDGVYIGFDWLFRIPGTNEMEGVIEPRLAFSRDLTDEWIRPTRMPLIPLGAPGSIDDGMIVTASSAIEVGDEVLLYCSAWDGDHGTSVSEACIFIAKWRLDGFASLDGGANGVITTRPFTFDGSGLFINADASNGALYAELLDENGDPIPGFAKTDCDVISSDSVKHGVSWNGSSDVSALAGREISLRIYAENSAVYSFRFGEKTADPLAPEMSGVVDYREKEGASGIRFRAFVDLDKRARADSYGFLVTREAYLENGDASRLFFGISRPDGSPAYAYADAYEKDPVSGEIRKDIQKAVDDEGTVTFTGVLVGIPVSREDEVMVARPYLRIGEHTFYGDPVKSTAALAKVGETVD